MQRESWWKALWRAIPASRAALAVSALALIACVTLISTREREPELSNIASDVVYRSSGIEAIAPSGDLHSAPMQLSWRPVPSARRYEVRLMEVDRTVLWHAETSEPSIVIPPAIRSRAIPGKRLMWSVNATSELGTVIANSAVQSFRVVTK